MLARHKLQIEVLANLDKTRPCLLLLAAWPRIGGDGILGPRICHRANPGEATGRGECLKGGITSEEEQVVEERLESHMAGTVHGMEVVL